MKRTGAQGHTPRVRSKRGMVLVFYALALMVLMAFVALVVDIGYMYTQKAQKQFLADMIALTTLGNAGSVSAGDTTAEQVAFINSQIILQNVANGLDSNYWTIYLKYSVETISGDSDSRNVTELKLNRPMTLTTFFLNLFSMPTITVGIESVAVRNCAAKTIDPDETGDLHFFGCNLVELQGFVTLRSYNFTKALVGDNMVGGSNTRWHSQGNNYVGGDAFSAGRIDYTGNSVTWNGTYTSDTVAGGPGAGSYTYVNEAYPEVIVPPAVGEATALDNDNLTVSGHDLVALTTDFILRASANKGTVTIPKGARIYARQVDLFGDKLVISDSGSTKPVTVTLDAQNKIPKDDIWFSDTDMETPIAGGMRPSYLKIIGINAPDSCDTTAPEGPKIQFKHHTGYALIYAPGFYVDIHSNPAFYGNIVADYIHMQGNPVIYADEENGFNFPTVDDPNDCEFLTRVHLIN